MDAYKHQNATVERRLRPMNGLSFSWINGVAFGLMLLLSLTTLLQPYGPFNAINKIVVIFIAALLLISFFQTRYHPAYWLLLFALAGLVVYDYIISDGSFSTLNDPFYLPFWFVIMMVFSQNSGRVNDLIVRNFTFVRAVVVVWCLLVGASAFVPASYYSGWGDGTYFGSIPQSIWRLAPCACLIQSALLMCLACDRKNRNLYLAFNMIPLFCGFMGGSRTYCLVIGLGFVIFLYYYADSVKQFRKYLVLAALGGLAAIGPTGIGAKIAATQYTDSSFFDFWGTITNGRSVIWRSEFDYFLNADPLLQLFGSGFDKVYEINLFSKLGAAVYAHNDFLNILIANGIVGLVLYFAPLVAMISAFSREFEGSKLIVWLCVSVWLVNAVFNMTYTYTCAVIAFALLPRGICLCDKSSCRQE